MNEIVHPENELPPPGRYGNLTFLGLAEIGNATEEELTFPVGKAKHASRVTILDGPPEIGNATNDELTLPVVDTSAETLVPEPQSKPVAESQPHRDRS